MRARAGALVVLVVLACFGVGLVARSASADDSRTGTWNIRLENSRTIDLDLSYRSDSGSWEEGNAIPFDPGRFPGLTEADLRADNAAVSFRIERDAGAFVCKGIFARGLGSGVFTYEAKPAFAAALRARGLGTPTEDEQFDMTMADVSLAMVDALRADNVSGLTTPALVRLADHGVNTDYVRALDAAGVKPAEASDYARLLDHGVTVEFVAQLRAHGYQPSVDDLIRLRDSGM